MKGRKSTELLHQEMLQKSLFKERFFVFQDTPAEAPAVPDGAEVAPEAAKIGEAPNAKVKPFLEKLVKNNIVQNFPSDISSVEAIAKDNPYMKHLNANLPKEAGFTQSADQGNGSLTIHPLGISNEEYYKALEAYAATYGINDAVWLRSVPGIGHLINAADPHAVDEDVHDDEFVVRKVDGAKDEDQDGNVKYLMVQANGGSFALVPRTGEAANSKSKWPQVADSLKFAPYTIEGFEYVALVWPKVRTLLGDTLSNSSIRIPPSRINEMAQAARNRSK